jgi:hypothetical protein
MLENKTIDYRVNLIQSLEKVYLKIEISVLNLNVLNDESSNSKI